MNFDFIKTPTSHGTGHYCLKDFKKIGNNVVFESNILVFHPENITIGSNVYIGHYSILKGYYKNELIIGDGTWIGQHCFLHSAGNISIGNCVGIGPYVKILTSNHKSENEGIPVLHNIIEFAPVFVDDGCDLGVGSIILPGVTIGKGSIIGAGSVVTKNVPEYVIAAGIPARILRSR